jgi:hypothetical protein
MSRPESTKEILPRVMDQIFMRYVDRIIREIFSEDENINKSDESEKEEGESHVI